MKNIFATLFVVAVLVFSYSCKRCYTCANQCTTCNGVRYDSAGFEIDTITLDTIGVLYNTVPLTHNFCSDDSTISSIDQYKALIAADTSAGYTCVPRQSSISYDYCVNKPGDEQNYQNYYNKNGRMICTQK
jgi:hypothetical protein